MNDETFDVIVVGGGAAGLMAASVSANRGLKTLVLEGNKILGRKILISGGGRCNFTNLYTESSNYLSKNSHFHKSALKRFSPYDFLDLIDKYNISYFEKKDGQLFCKTSAKEVISLLEKECLRGQAQIVLSSKVHDIQKKDLFHVSSSKGDFKARNIVVASGGLPISMIGATDFGLKVAKFFGHDIEETSPALVPFTLEESLLCETSKLSGVSLRTKIKTDHKAFVEDILFTHKGLSGPGILQASLYWNRAEKVSLDFLPELSEEDLLKSFQKNSKKVIDSFLKIHLPKKFVDFFCRYEALSLTKKMAEYSKDERMKVISQLKDFSFRPSGTEGYRKAEVMKGGVSTDQISSKTMESKIVKGLFFVGEVVDVTGELGGFNFQWAWASGNAAGQSII
ncbi:NAD(P)/FAD-dependent oxidoreductase [Halobacteriovorax sp. HLS]|uniref:NAD(P)/FAD-dependent oxidoreductase n=1 Tax=Halobacteriovorax sp. HLS TaxID=2234000 RepID=UPI000FD7647F|nr:NAD(P)/FAD-dependent oxidoreductase [Halobacteriovorax sp. HLS]